MLLGCKLGQYIWKLCEKGLSRKNRKDEILLTNKDDHDIKSYQLFFNNNILQFMEILHSKPS